MSGNVIRMIAIAEYEPNPDNYPADCDSIEDMADLDFEALQDDPFFFFDLGNVAFDFEIVQDG